MPEAEFLLGHITALILVSNPVPLLTTAKSLKKKMLPVKYVFVVFHSYSLLTKPYIILAFSRQVFTVLVAEQRFVDFGML